MIRPTPVECRTCKALFYWVKTSNNKPMPVNATPDPNGGLVLTLRIADGVPELHAEAYVATEFKHQNRNRYTSHFVTCPQSREHRKPTPK